MKVTVLGAAGGIGQPLSLLLKTHLPAGSQLALYDVSPATPGVALDLSHIPTDVEVTGFTGKDPSEALKGADVVVMPAGVARKPGMTRDDLFNINAGIVKNLVQAIAENAPKACIAIITNPVNSMVPIAAEVLKKAGVYDKRKLFGVTMLDTLRAETLIPEALHRQKGSVKVPVIGGHSGTTILPVFSQVTGNTLDDKTLAEMTQHVQNAGTDVVNAKAGAGSATLSMAAAGNRMALALVSALRGAPGIVEPAFVESDSSYAPFFAHQVRLGLEGIEEILPLPKLNEREQKDFDDMLQTLNDNIKKGVDFAQK